MIEHKKLLCEYLQELNQTILNVSNNFHTRNTVDILTQDLAIVIFNSDSKTIDFYAEYHSFEEVIQERCLIFYIYDIKLKQIKDINLLLIKNKIKGIFSAKLSILKIIQFDTVKNCLLKTLKSHNIKRNFQISITEMKLQKKSQKQIEIELEEHLRKQLLYVTHSPFIPINKSNSQLSECISKQLLHNKIIEQYLMRAQDLVKRLSESNAKLHNFITDHMKILETWICETDDYLLFNNIINDNLHDEHVNLLKAEKKSHLKLLEELMKN